MSPHTTRDIGKAGELQARRYLERLGMRFVAANWSSKVGEIDLIMQEGASRVFVEVRQRRPTSFGEGYETVARQKQQKLIRTAKLYQQRENYWGEIRFDVVSITQISDEESQLQHIEAAFDVSAC